MAIRLEKYSIIHDITDIVYLKTDPDQRPRIVTGILLTRTSVQYTLACGYENSTHYDFELRTERDIALATSS